MRLRSATPTTTPRALLLTAALVLGLAAPAAAEVLLVGEVRSSLTCHPSPGFAVRDPVAIRLDVDAFTATVAQGVGGSELAYVQRIASDAVLHLERTAAETGLLEVIAGELRRSRSGRLKFRGYVLGRSDAIGCLRVGTIKAKQP